MMLMPANRFAALVFCCTVSGIVNAADPLPVETQIVAASTAAAPTQVSFTIASAQDLVVTLTDLQIPAELASAGVVVTQAGAVAGSAQLTAPATSATVALPGATGAYTLYVFGVPNSSYSVGSFSACVAPKANPSNCLQTASVAGLISAPGSAKDPTVSTLSTTLSVTTAGAYTFNFTDLAFPTALNTAPNLALFQGSTPIIPPGQTGPGITAGSSLTLSPGQYTLLSIAQADQTVQQGLYNIIITGPSGTQPLLSSAVPVGLLAAATTCANPSSQSLTLSVVDYAFPGPLASASALLTAGGAAVGTASAAGGAQTFNGPAGNLQLWTYGSLGSTAGTYSADVSSGSTDLCTTAQGVGPSAGSSGGTTYAYAYVVPAPALTTAGVYTNTPLAAGNYTATAADLQFPSQLGGLAFAVAQNGVILQQSATAATLNFTAAAGDAVVLVSAMAPSSTTTSNGLFDVNVQATGSSAALLFDKTQSVSATPALFNAQSISVADNDSYDVTLTDLQFPVAFDNLGLIVSRGSQVLGKVFGAGKFSFAGSPGTYQLTFVATASADQLFGLYSTSVVYSPPTVALTSNVSSAATGASITLTSSASNADSCTASGGWTGTIPTTMTTTTETLSATTTYTLSCTGGGGTVSQSVSVTATAAPKSGGGGALDWTWLLVASALVAVRLRRPDRPMGSA